MVVILGREGTRYEPYARRVVRRLVALSVAQRGARRVLEAIFDGTRRAIVTILASDASDAEVREAIGAFRSYQIAGLAGFASWLRGARPRR